VDILLLSGDQIVILDPVFLDESAQTRERLYLGRVLEIERYDFYSP
jgi:hypothetical protein